MSRHIGPCMCGAIDCPSCGPAQGYHGHYERAGGKLKWVMDDKPIDEDEPEPEPAPEPNDQDPRSNL